MNAGVDAEVYVEDVHGRINKFSMNSSQKAYESVATENKTIYKNGGEETV